jgi:SHAQKYF class myb-like DNA-binding protein
MKAIAQTRRRKLPLSKDQRIVISYNSNTSSSENCEITRCLLHQGTKNLKFQIEEREVRPKFSIRGRWTKEEKARFVIALTKFGKNWRKVEAYVGTRTNEQIRSHAQKYFLKQKPKASTSESKEMVLNPVVTSRYTIPCTNLDQLKLLEQETQNLLNKLNNPNKQFNSLLKLQKELIAVSQESFKIQSVNKCNEGINERCVSLIKITNKGIQELALILKRSLTPYSPFLVQRMQHYGFTTLNEINSSYLRLPDWVDMEIKSRYII